MLRIRAFFVLFKLRFDRWDSTQTWLKISGQKKSWVKPLGPMLCGHWQLHHCRGLCLFLASQFDLGGVHSDESLAGALPCPWCWGGWGAKEVGDVALGFGGQLAPPAQILGGWQAGILEDDKYRVLVTKEQCKQVMSLDPNNEALGRCRAVDQGGAKRMKREEHYMLSGPNQPIPHCIRCLTTNPLHIILRYIIMLISCVCQNIVEKSLSHFFWTISHDIYLISTHTESPSVIKSAYWWSYF